MPPFASAKSRARLGVFTVVAIWRGASGSTSENVRICAFCPPPRIANIVPARIWSASPAASSGVRVIEAGPTVNTLSPW